MASVTRQHLHLPLATQSALEEETRAWRDDDRMGRLWRKDPSLWTNRGEEQWLGWLDVLDAWKEGRPDVEAALAARDAHPDLRHVIVMGMGGSSLCPDVLARTFGRQPGAPELLVLDSTDPAQLRSLESRIDLARSLFVVPSKSGKTIEPNSFEAYFFERVRECVSQDAAGRHFIAITDPRTLLDERAAAAGYAAICHGLPSIGGRFSALSVFGLVPAALMGLDVERLVERAGVMAAACGAEADTADNPGLQLGLALGLLAASGRDKLTIVSSPALEAFGAWLEQLIAESTGKLGNGVIPVHLEELGAPETYGADRVFAVLRLAGSADQAQDAAVAALERAGQPILRVELDDLYDLAQEFFRWEIATAVAGVVLGVNPFDQPDVEAAKTAALAWMDGRAAGEDSAEAGFSGRGGDLSFQLPPETERAPALRGSAASPTEALASLFASLRAGDYFSINAFLEMNTVNLAALAQARHAVRAATGVATTLGFGPRFLHSTGQLHKGGPPSGVFLQLTCDDLADVSIPGQPYSFGILKSAQASGDFSVLAERGRRVLHIHIHGDLTRGLDQLNECVERALERTEEA